MKTINRKAVINALAKQIRLVEQQGNHDQAEKLKTILVHQLEDEPFAEADLVDLDLAHAELAHTQAQLETASSQNDAEAVRYWQHQLARTQHTLAELTAKRSDITH